MTVYVAMIDDRHGDPEPFLFSSPDQAIAYARAQAMEYNHHEEGFKEHDPPPVGWLYYATYSTEGDSVWVLSKTVDDPEATP